MTWLLHLIGVDNEAGRWYAFWSGFGSDISELAIVGAVVGGYKKHNCHQRRCWRIGRHVVDGSPYCDRHHQAARTERDAR